MKRYIEEEYPSFENIDQMNYRDPLRLAAEIKLIDQVEPWFQFREARNKTSHAYDEKKAAEVFLVIPDFIKSVVVFLKNFDERTGKS